MTAVCAPEICVSLIVLNILNLGDLSCFWIVSSPDEKKRVVFP
jgi:hypothetical protein